MLYQLIAYYTIDKGIEKSLWDYLSLTVIIFQNAAVLEVRVHYLYLSTYIHTLKPAIDP